MRLPFALAILLTSLLAMLPVPTVAIPGDRDGQRLAVPVVIDRQTIPYREFAIYLMPDQRFHVSLGEASARATARFLGSSHVLGGAMLQAPSTSGLDRLEIRNSESGEVAVINVFTMVPADRMDASGQIDGYRIGRYPAEPLRDLDIYRPPEGFVEVTAENADTRVSPNFRLGQFISRQPDRFPGFLALRVDLLLNLETILDTLNRRGHPTENLVIMSGHRTPAYNRAIGNVPYSRHLWGGAADIYIDEAPADGRMDDLDGDGRVTRDDALWLADFVNEISHNGGFGPRIGGLGIYGSTAAHGPFIHVDVRGTLARW